MRWRVTSDTVADGYTDDNRRAVLTTITDDGNGARSGHPPSSGELYTGFYEECEHGNNNDLLRALCGVARSRSAAPAPAPASRAFFAK